MLYLIPCRPRPFQALLCFSVPREPRPVITRRRTRAPKPSPSSLPPLKNVAQDPRQAVKALLAVWFNLYGVCLPLRSWRQGRRAAVEEKLGAGKGLTWVNSTTRRTPLCFLDLHTKQMYDSTYFISSMPLPCAEIDQLLHLPPASKDHLGAVGGARLEQKHYASFSSRSILQPERE